MKRSRRKHESTAYHEAGHAVAAVVLGLKIGKRGVSIIPDKENDTLGTTHVLRQLRENPECARSAGMQWRLERQAITCFAGDAAERKFNGGRRFGGRQDYQRTAGLLAHVATSWEQHDARIEVARLGARDLVEANWSSIQAVAEELLRRKTLNAADLKAIVLRCDEELNSELDRTIGLV
jgi:ATP-dependent Zn protease